MPYIPFSLSKSLMSGSAASADETINAFVDYLKEKREEASTNHEQGVTDLLLSYDVIDKNNVLKALIAYFKDMSKDDSGKRGTNIMFPRLDMDGVTKAYKMAVNNELDTRDKISELAFIWAGRGGDTLPTKALRDLWTISGDSLAKVCQYSGTVWSGFNYKSTFDEVSGSAEDLNEQDYNYLKLQSMPASMKPADTRKEDADAQRKPCSNCWICGEPIYAYKWKRKDPSKPSKSLYGYYKCGEDEHVIPPGFGNILSTLYWDKKTTDGVWTRARNKYGNNSAIMYGVLPSHAWCNQTKGPLIFIKAPYKDDLGTWHGHEVNYTNVNVYKKKLMMRFLLNTHPDALNGGEGNKNTHGGNNIYPDEVTHYEKTHPDRGGAIREYIHNSSVDVYKRVWDEEPVFKPKKAPRAPLQGFPHPRSGCYKILIDPHRNLFDKSLYDVSTMKFVDDSCCNIVDTIQEICNILNHGIYSKNITTGPGNSDPYLAFVLKLVYNICNTARAVLFPKANGGGKGKRDPAIGNRIKRPVKLPGTIQPGYKTKKYLKGKNTTMMSRHTEKSNYDKKLKRIIERNNEHTDSFREYERPLNDRVYKRGVDGRLERNSSNTAVCNSDTAEAAVKANPIAAFAALFAAQADIPTTVNAADAANHHITLAERKHDENLGPITRARAATLQADASSTSERPAKRTLSLEEQYRAIIKDAQHVVRAENGSGAFARYTACTVANYVEAKKNIVSDRLAYKFKSIGSMTSLDEDKDDEGGREGWMEEKNMRDIIRYNNQRIKNLYYKRGAEGYEREGEDSYMRLQENMRNFSKDINTEYDKPIHAPYYSPCPHPYNLRQQYRVTNPGTNPVTNPGTKPGTKRVRDGEGITKKKKKKKRKTKKKTKKKTKTTVLNKVRNSMGRFTRRKTKKKKEKK